MVAIKWILQLKTRRISAVDICDKLIDLRIELMSCCDGFSSKDSNKDLILSSKLKILHLLSQKDLTPNELIDKLCIAKSNLANLSKTLINEGVIDSYKTAGNSRNIFYRITDEGRKLIEEYKSNLNKLLDKHSYDKDTLSYHIDEILQILKKGIIC